MVVGADTSQIDASIFANTPVLINGNKFGAVTHNVFSTSYATVGTRAGGCEVKNVHVVLDSSIILPKLSLGQYSAAVLAEWQRHIGALTAHEMQHANNGRYTAETIAGRLYNFKSAMPCEVMRPRLDQAIQQLIRNMGAWDERLDRETNHGETQGAYIRKGIK